MKNISRNYAHFVTVNMIATLLVSIGPANYNIIFAPKTPRSLSLTVLFCGTDKRERPYSFLRSAPKADRASKQASERGRERAAL